MPRKRSRSVYAKEFTLTVTSRGKKITKIAKSERGIEQAFLSEEEITLNKNDLAKIRKSKWEGYDWYKIPNNPNNKRKHYASGKSREEVYIKLDEIYTKITDEINRLQLEEINDKIETWDQQAIGRYESTPTLFEYAKETINQRLADGVIQESTSSTYKSFVRNQLLLEVESKEGCFVLGNLKLTDIKRKHIQNWLNQIHANKYSSVIVWHCKNFIALTLKRAYYQQLIHTQFHFEKKHPEAITIPRVVHKAKIILTKEEIDRLLDSLVHPIDKAMIALALHGLRPQENLCTQWTDISGGLLHVHRQLSYDEQGKIFIKATKTNHERYIPIRKKLMPFIMASKDIGSKWVVPHHRLGGKNEGTGITEGCMHPSFARKRFRKLLENAGLAPNYFYILRSTAATLYSRSSKSTPKDVQKYFGWSSPQVAMNHYEQSNIDHLIEINDDLDEE
jgi:integrase